MKGLKKKIRSSAGETLAEALVAVLIIALAVLMLAGGIVASARVNAGVKNENVVFKRSESGTAGTVEIYHRLSQSTSRKNVTLHETENGYVYYEIQE